MKTTLEWFLNPNKIILPRKFFGVFLFVLLSSQCFSQQKDTVKYINKQVNIDVEAHYPQGEMALYSHFFQNLKFPEEAKKKTIDAVISLSYEVMPDSTVGNITVLKKIGYGVDEEITKILKPLKFAPRIEEGVPVRSNMMLNIPIQRRGDL